MILGFVLLLGILLLLSVPVAFSLALTGMAGMFFLLDGFAAFSQVPLIAYKTLDEFVLSAIPLYILMSQILLAGKVGSDLYDVAGKWLRHLPGGLGITTIMACALFSAISGSSVATAVTIGAVAIPEMLSRGYDKKLVYGTLAAGGTLGILIPPSIPMILYGSITGESVGELFISGIVPGVLLTCFFMLLMLFKARNMPRQQPATWSERVEALRRSSFGLFLPVLIVGGIYTGIFTPTEAAAVGTVYSLFITFFVYKSLTVKELPAVLMDSVKTTTMIFAIMIGAILFGHVLTILQLPQKMTEIIAQADVNRWLIFVAINVLLLFLGCILETVSIILITLPILYPLIMSLGFDPIWFNVVLLVNMELALITPPVGMNLFVIKGLGDDIKLNDIVAGVLPFGIIMVLFIILLAIFPEIATWLPKYLK